jgi:tetratricopeptide (TPR) repeat protein
MIFTLRTAITLPVLLFFTNPSQADEILSCGDMPSLQYSIEQLITDCNFAIRGIGYGMDGTGNPRGRPRTPEARASGYYGRGLLYHLAGKLDLAIADYTSAIGWDHDYGDAYEARGDAYEDSGEKDKAREDYATAARLASDGPGRLLERCWVRTVRGHPLRLALADCNEAIKKSSNEMDMLSARCFVYYKLANYQAAIADCATAERARPRMAETLYVGGLAKIRAGDTAGGNADIAAATDADYRVAEKLALYGFTR